MKFYSEKLKSLFDSEKELKEAETKLELEKAEKEKKLDLKKAEAKKVEEAYKKALEVRKEAYKQIDAADAEFYKLRREFVDKYGSWHMTYTNEDDSEGSLSDTFSWVADVMKEYFGL